MPRTDDTATTDPALETKCVSHDVYKRLTLAGNYITQAKSNTNLEDWDSADTDIEETIQILQVAREKVVAVREKHGVKEG